MTGKRWPHEWEFKPPSKKGPISRNTNYREKRSNIETKSFISFVYASFDLCCTFIKDGGFVLHGQPDEGPPAETHGTHNNPVFIGLLLSYICCIWAFSLVYTVVG